MTDTTPPVQPPDTITWSFRALLVAAVFAFITPLVLLTQRTWLQNNAIKYNNDHHKSNANVHSQTTQSLTFYVIVGVVLAAGLVWLAFRLRKGNYASRWVLIAVYILMAFTGYGLIGVTGLVSIAGSIPTVVKVPTFIGAVALAAAIVLSLLKPSSAYLGRNRTPRVSPAAGPAGARPPGGLLGSLFAPRPPAQRSKVIEHEPAANAGASTSGQPMKRGKAKARTSVEATVTDAPAAPRRSKAKGR